MNIYKYNPKAKYSPNHGTYFQQLTVKDLIEPKIFVDQQRNSFTPKFLNVFERYVVTSNSATHKALNTWNKHPFLLWMTQVDFAVFCATSACGISMEHLNNSHPMIRAIYRFHTYFQIRKILYDLEVALPSEHRFKRLNNAYNVDAFKRLCSQFEISHDETVWKTQYFFSSWQAKRKEYSLSPGLEYFNENSWSRWIIETSNGLTEIGIERLSQSIRFYAYLILESQASARSDIIGIDSKAFDAQRMFVTSFENIVKKPSNIQDEIAQFQQVLKYAKSKVDFVAALQVYMIPSNLNLHIGTIENYNNKILVSEPNFSIGLNTNVNSQNHKPSLPTTKTTTKTKTTQPDNHLSVKIAKEHEEEKTALIIFGVGLIIFVKWWWFK